jgi:hypothetical protein
LRFAGIVLWRCRKIAGERTGRVWCEGAKGLGSGGSLRAGWARAAHASLELLAILGFFFFFLVLFCFFQSWFRQLVLRAEMDAFLESDF